MAKMRAARMHTSGGPMIMDEVDRPEPGPMDVIVRVRSCGIVPNLANILTNWVSWFPERPLPPLPAIFGLDPAGEITAVGSRVYDWQVGDRVYVNPGRYCGGCRPCRNGDHLNCAYYTFNGYFGFSEKSLKIFKDYPYGGLAEYMLAPQYALVRLAENISFDQATRFGYLGTGFSALRKLGVTGGKTLLINGVSGTLGLGVALIALARGVTKILGTARNQQLLDRVKALAPHRIEVFSTESGRSIADWTSEVTAGAGVDLFIDALGPGTSASVLLDGMKSLNRGGRAIDIGAIAGDVPFDLHTMMDCQNAMEGSLWFTAGEGQDMADMAAAGTLDLKVFEQICYPLSQLNEAISGIANRNGGFSNYVINP